MRCRKKELLDEAMHCRFANNQWQSTLIAVCRERRQEAGALVLTREEERPNNRSHPLIDQGAPRVIPDAISSVLDRLFDPLTLITGAMMIAVRHFRTL